MSTGLGSQRIGGRKVGGPRASASHAGVGPGRCRCPASPRRNVRRQPEGACTVYQLAAELPDHDAPQLQSACGALKRRMLVTGDATRGWALTGIGEAHLAHLAIARARR
jgi:hypothetical protein